LRDGREENETSFISMSSQGGGGAGDDDVSDGRLSGEAMISVRSIGAQSMLWMMNEREGRRLGGTK
jgi:hypothetical protein